MSLTEQMPGMKPGSTVGNLIVAVLYFIFLPLLVAALPLVAGVLVYRNDFGLADRLAALPGISAEGGAVAAVAAAVYTFVLLGVVGAVVPADDTSSGPSETGPSGEGAESPTATDGGSPADASSPSTATPTDADSTPTNTPTLTPTPTNTPTPERSVEVRIIYDDAWQGSVGVSVDGSYNSKSVQGEGTKTISVDPDADSVSVNAQKDDDSRQTLTVQIVVDGEVVSEATTDAEYGVAQTSTNV